MTVKADLIASLVQQEFDKLPAKRKPGVRDNGLREWVPLSGIVAEERDGTLTCLSLATGMKCLPSSKIQEAQGNVLHDWHAEVLAIRAFNCFVLDECRGLVSGSRTASKFIRHRFISENTDGNDNGDGYVDVDVNMNHWHGQPFTWRDDVLLHMYCSEAPCGDASMELTMASQEDATPWAIPAQEKRCSPNLTSPPFPPTATISADPEATLLGRGYFSHLGIVRRKPSRGDAPPTLSKSCSDKLSLHQCTSLLSSLTSLLVSPEHAYISTLVLPSAQYSASGCRRAFSDGLNHSRSERGGNEEARMAPLASSQYQHREDGSSIGGGGGGYAFRPFVVETTDLEFIFSRRAAALPPQPSSPSPSHTSLSSTSPKVKITPSPLSTAHTASSRTETTLNGVLQGRKASAASLAGASFASRRRTWALACEVAELLEISSSLSKSSYTQGLHTLFIQKALLGVSNPSRPQKTSREEREVDTTTEKNGLKTAMEVSECSGPTYAQVKGCALLGPRKRMKEVARREALKGWVRNLGDEDFWLQGNKLNV
ncbi:adenosine deaminase/editase [Astrocystis sublimbata]|nr:adenosine deaminase/editase [Astrocystis sublimbata]